MLIAIPAEVLPGEFRVAATPETIKKLIKAGHTVRVESKAGQHAAITDTAYTEAGAEIAPHPAALYQGAQLILKVRAPLAHELPLLPERAALVALFDIHRYDHLDALNAKQISAYALELIPRITRAQSMDVLSSQANIAGYRAVLLATQYYPRFMPMLMTAAGTVKPARVLILGAGVAGLQAIATAKRLGAIVEVFDVRPATREQVESLGGKFIEVALNDDEKAAAETAGGYAREMSEDYKLRQALLIDQQARLADIIISTAQIPGKAAPVLIPEETVSGMKTGSVIIDLAVDSGGNCPLSRSDEVVRSENGVIIVGHSNLASLLAADASALYARNLLTFLSLLQDADGAYAPHNDDEIIKATLLSQHGEQLFGRAPAHTQGASAPHTSQPTANA
ncbi:Re/Si-specific NAD(P)(+) transhydrogenase subunit alpha [Iodobacter fluviatilis]|uniref:NAD(P) transhydrogenase subunit alpha part 1 n=1 Tax=Iodobacter fluviatilis TaxID=537 RepID=A0A377Q6S4_9NEIS|nr:Re/Si-specific NAD(P)(+) transhydrogenase subunit alpha [Iodobacter fluviatilis]TCU87126.1 NAD(P) transhydrogenase subunit alpha [Iodobacter fluviatilis]STQ90458.1 NAD(P) transhydrogenase subunit alpha part 1 [Iodobacter fluviatilis]